MNSHSFCFPYFIKGEEKSDSNGQPEPQSIEVRTNEVTSTTTSTTTTTPPPPTYITPDKVEDEKRVEKTLKDVYSVLYGPKESSSSSSVVLGQGDALHGKPAPTYIFWPPVRQQRRYPDLSPMRLSSVDNILVCISSAEVDIFPLLLSSGLIEILDNFGLQGVLYIHTYKYAHITYILSYINHKIATFIHIDIQHF